MLENLPIKSSCQKCAIVSEEGTTRDVVETYLNMMDILLF